MALPLRVEQAGCDDSSAQPQGAWDNPSLSFGETVSLAQAEDKAGRRPAARAAFERALFRVSNSAESRQISSVLRWIARTFHVDGEADVALHYLDAALAVAEATNDDASAGHAINVQAVVNWQRGEMDEAERLYLLARSRALRAGDAKLAAMTAQNLGVLANIRGDFEIAERQYTASLADYRSLGLTSDVCIALNNLGLLFMAQERWEEAEQVLTEAGQVCEFTGNAMGRTQIDINLAELWVKRRVFSRAQSAVRKALTTASQTGDASAIGKATKLLGVIARETGSFDDADRHLQRADEVATARGELLLQAEIARERADLARRMGRNREVLQQLNRSHRLFTILRAQPDLADVGERVENLEQEFLHVARRWGEQIEAKDRYTQGHCQRVAELACAIAHRSGFDKRALFWFRIGALLHDVGKVEIPPEVLNKPGKLDDAEWQQMKSHTTIGVEMLADIEFPWDVRPIVESHHERWDGKGYPHGLAGDAIPLIARILTIADVYDALTSVRSYKRAHSHDDAMVTMRRDVGTMFDPEVFAWFEEVAHDWPSRVVQLTDEVGENTPDDPGVAPQSSMVHAVDMDDLTRLPGRRAFRETAERTLDARKATGRPVSLLVIDVDHFKLVNDTYGHLQGDAVLAFIANQIRAAVRPSDYPARYAGDEFVVLLPGTRVEDACVIAERIRELVSGQTVSCLDATRGSLSVTLSIGVACASYQGETVESLFGTADNALYGAKRNGRDQVTSAARLGADKKEMLLDCFVGRLAERERLRDLLASAASGEPRVAVLLGEGGIGKSALLKQLRPDVGVRAGAVLMGQCIEANIGIPYGPWADIIAAAHRAGLVPTRPWRELSRLVPELPADTHANGDSRGGSQRALLEELEEFLQLATQSRPLMLVLDDMQWADAASWDMLEFLLVRLRDQRLLTCLTIRPEEMSAASESRLRRLSRYERCSEVNLGRLSREELAQWLRSTLGGQAASEALLEHVARQSEGNAFFAVQTMRALVEDGQLRASDGVWHFDQAHNAPVPRAIGDLVARRVERLSRDRRDVLAMAAVLGREFDPELLVAACECGEPAVHEALDDALANAVLVPSGRERPTLSFTHALLTRALLQGLNPLRLRRMHERVARTLEQAKSSDTTKLALHFDQAGIATDAYRTALGAGVQAQAVYAFENAAECFAIARRNAGDDRQAATVVWHLAQVDEQGGHYSRAEEHVQALLTEHATGTEALALTLAVRRMRVRLRQQRGAPADQMLEACRALLADARTAGNAEESVALLIMLSTSQQRIGDIAAAEQLAREAIEAAEPLARPSLQAEAVMRLGSVLLSANPANAVPHYRRALDMFTALGDRFGQLRCQINVGTACDRAGNHPAAEASYLVALDIAREVRATDLSGAALLNLGVLLLKTGHFARARTRFEDALKLFVSIGHEPYRLASLYNLAHVARAQGDAAGALELYSTCVTLAGSISQVDVHIGAIAGAGLAELDLNAIPGAQDRCAMAAQLIDGRDDWWFQGRELCVALEMRLEAAECRLTDRRHDLVNRLLAALLRAEAQDRYASLWLGAECRDLLRDPGVELAAVRERLHMQARALGFDALAERLVTGD